MLGLIAQREGHMKQILCILLFFSSFIGTAYAEGKPVRSREECAAIAVQRGFTNKPKGSKGQFIHDCRHGLVK
jgi:hypothetical protein